MAQFPGIDFLRSLFVLYFLIEVSLKETLISKANSVWKMETSQNNTWTLSFAVYGYFNKHCRIFRPQANSNTGAQPS